MEELLKIEDLSKSFTIHNLNKHIMASKDINISLKEGEFVGITGKSGSGKSTILNVFIELIYQKKVTYGTDLRNSEILIYQRLQKEK